MVFTDICNVLSAAFPKLESFSVRPFSTIDGGSVGLDNGQEYIHYELTIVRTYGGNRKFEARSPEECVAMAVHFAMFQ